MASGHLHCPELSATRSPLPGAWFSHTGSGHQHSRKCLFFDFLFPRNKQRVSYLTIIHNVGFMTSLQKIVDRSNSLSAIIFAFVAVIMVTAFRGKSGSKNTHFCDCADVRMYLTITLLVMAPAETHTFLRKFLFFKTAINRYLLIPLTPNFNLEDEWTTRQWTHDVKGRMSYLLGVREADRSKLNFEDEWTTRQWTHDVKG